MPQSRQSVSQLSQVMCLGHVKTEDLLCQERQGLTDVNGSLKLPSFSLYPHTDVKKNSH